MTLTSWDDSVYNEGNFPLKLTRRGGETSWEPNVTIRGWIFIKKKAEAQSFTRSLTFNVGLMGRRSKIETAGNRWLVLTLMGS